MSYTEDFFERLRVELADQKSVPAQLYARIRELRENHRNGALAAGDTDFEKGKVAAFDYLVQEIESSNKPG